MSGRTLTHLLIESKHGSTKPLRCSTLKLVPPTRVLVWAGSCRLRFSWSLLVLDLLTDACVQSAGCLKLSTVCHHFEHRSSQPRTLENRSSHKMMPMMGMVSTLIHGSCRKCGIRSGSCTAYLGASLTDPQFAALAATPNYTAERGDRHEPGHTTAHQQHKCLHGSGRHSPHHPGAQGHGQAHS